MVLFFVIGVLAVLATTGVNCESNASNATETEQPYVFQSHSILQTENDGHINTITTVDDNGHKEIIRQQIDPDGRRTIYKKVRDGKPVPPPEPHRIIIIRPANNFDQMSNTMDQHFRKMSQDFLSAFTQPPRYDDNGYDDRYGQNSRQLHYDQSSGNYELRRRRPQHEQQTDDSPNYSYWYRRREDPDNREEEEERARRYKYERTFDEVTEKQPWYKRWFGSSDKTDDQKPEVIQRSHAREYPRDYQRSDNSQTSQGSPNNKGGNFDDIFHRVDNELNRIYNQD